MKYTEHYSKFEELILHPDAAGKSLFTPFLWRKNLFALVTPVLPQDDTDPSERLQELEVCIVLVVKSLVLSQRNLHSL